MDIGIFVPLLLPLVVWPFVRFLRAGVSPEFASWLFTAAAVVLSIGSTVVLALLAFAAVAPEPAVAQLSGWTPQTPWSVEAAVPVGVCCGAALLVIGLSALTADGTEVGTIVAVHDFGAGDILELRPPPGGTTIMLPFNEACVPEVDIAGGRIIVALPAATPGKRGDATE